MTDILQSIFDSIVHGKIGGVQAQIHEALDANMSVEKILEEGMISAMTEVGERFEFGRLYIPEMLIAARTMKAGLHVLQPHLVKLDISSAGKVILGTVWGDVHEIGKDLVAMMLEGNGFEVVDLGTEVSPEEFVNAIQEEMPQLVGMSALLTTTMPSMKTTIEAIQEAGLRDSVGIMVGGAPVTNLFATEIGADGYASDAIKGVTLAKKLVEEFY